MKTLSLKKIITLLFIVIAFTANLSSCSKSGSNPTTPNNSTKTTVTSLSVNQGPYATRLEINGTGFVSGQNNQNKVQFNGKETPVLLSLSTRLTVLVPLATGSGPVTVTVNGKTVTGPTFTYTPELVVTPYVGNDKFGFADGKGNAAQFYETNSIAFDKNGNMYITDAGNHSIRKVTPDGTVTTFAGNGTRGRVDGLGSQATFDGPTGITVDAAGNVFVAENYNNLIRKITPDGLVTTLAGNPSPHYQDGVGKLAGFDGPLGITCDATGNLFVVETDHRIRKITPDGVVSTFAGNGLDNLANGTGTNAGIGSPVDITIDKAGNLYVIDVNKGVIRKITSDATVSTYFDASTHEPGVANPSNIAIDGLGNLYLSDGYNHLIKMIKPDKTMSVYAGILSGIEIGLYGPALKTMLIYPQGLAIDAANNVYFTDRYGVKKISVQ